MRKVKLYIAVSLDGYIARPNGELDWLVNLPNPNKIDHGYTEFYQTLDTTIIGRKTYQEVLGFGVDWPYSNCRTYVVSSNASTPIETPATELIDSGIIEQVRELKKEAGKDIWLIGGGELITWFINEGLVDEMTLNIIPVILGKGIPLFPGMPNETSI